MAPFPSLWRKKKLVVFDMDGTLTPSKSPLRPSTARLLAALLEEKKVAVVSGAKFSQIRIQIIGPLGRYANGARYENLLMFPVTAARFYRYRNGWRKVYEKKFSASERRTIFGAFHRALGGEDFKLRHHHGAIVEDRGTEVTFSALGQRAPLREKEAWNEKNDFRPELLKALKSLLPEYEERIAGLTSIDVTKKGIDKAFAVRQVEAYLHIPTRDILFVGDALYRGGNDAPALKTGVAHCAVKDPRDTERLIRFLVAR